MPREPSPLLQEFLPIFPKGRALDVAMGEGRNALFLAAHGYTVEGLERDLEAIQNCRRLAREKNLTIHTQQVDLEHYTIEANAYDLIICFYYLQRNLIPQMKDGLKSGGMLVYETFLIDQHLRYGKPKHPEYCFEHNELLNLFRDFRVLFYKEGIPEDQTISVSLIARK